MPAPRCQWLHEPAAIVAPGWRRIDGRRAGAGHGVDVGRGAPPLAERTRDEHRVAHAPEHGGSVPPQRAPGGERRHSTGMIVEAREVRDGVALDGARGVRRGAGADASRRSLASARAHGLRHADRGRRTHRSRSRRNPLAPPIRRPPGSRRPQRGPGQAAMFAILGASNPPGSHQQLQDIDVTTGSICG